MISIPGQGPSPWGSQSQYGRPSCTPRSVGASGEGRVLRMAGIMTGPLPPMTQQDPITGSAVYPLGSRVNARGHLEVAGCDTVELAAEFGTPAYVYAEDDMRARARAYLDAFRAHGDAFDVVYASKAAPVSAILRAFVEEGLSIDVASGGELHLALEAGCDPARI